jgi:hypothetical protein
MFLRFFHRPVSFLAETLYFSYFAPLNVSGRFGARRVVSVFDGKRFRLEIFPVATQSADRAGFVERVKRERRVK